MVAFLLAILLSGPAVAADRTVLPVTADVSIACYPDERRFNAGGSPRLKLKGNENLILLKFDTTSLAGRRVVSATLHVKPTGPHQMLRAIGISTVGADWGEGGGAGESEAKEGEACFLSSGTAHGRRWAGDESNFLDVVFGRGGTFWVRATARPEPNGWIAVDMEGRVIEACAAGLSYGLAMSDDNGQTMRVHKDVDPHSNLGNNYLFSREQSGGAPWLEVVSQLLDPVTPSALEVSVAPWAGGSAGRLGGVEIAWDGRVGAGAVGLLGYRVRLTAGGHASSALSRWMHPAVPPAGEQARAHLIVPANSSVTAEVEIIGRGGLVVAQGVGSGFASSIAARPAALPLPSLHTAAGDPPGTGSARIWAVPDAVKVDPRTGAVLEDATGEYLRANPVWSGKDRAVHLAALRGEWIAYQVVLGHAGEQPVSWRLAAGELAGPKGKKIPASAIRLARVIHIADGAGGWVPDPLIPLAAATSFAVPDPRHPVPGQTVQPVYVELFVPRDAPAGRYVGWIEAVPGEGLPIRLAVNLAVGPATLPEDAHFTWSMNAYGSPGHPYGAAGTPAFAAAERAAYVMAHDHRATLAILHYSHSGSLEVGCVPAVTGIGDRMKVKDWTEWDRRFGPLFDGTAFAGTSRPRAPLDHFYLALSEHYPTSMADGYKWNSLRWEDHWKTAGPIEEGFSAAYQDQWMAVARDYLAHIKAKGWATTFQVYLNDKYFYKMYDPKKKVWGKGVSFWLLDEPVNADDFIALRFFGRLLRRATNPERSLDPEASTSRRGDGDRKHIIFRADVSQPEWSRDTLDRVLDINVSGGLAASQRLLWNWREQHGQKIWTYGDSPGARDSNLMLSITALDLYTRGVDGYVPWLVLGTPDQWATFSTTSVLYAGTPAGLTAPCASLRLKAYRRAEQDVEYLWLYAMRHDLFRGDPNRMALAGLLRGTLGAQKRMGKLDAEGAETTAYDQVDPARLEILRRALAADF